jgi:cytochrome bd-type quinol oxidase subunit 2
MQIILLNIHHYLAFAALILIAWATLNGVLGTTSEKVWEDKHRKVNLFALIATHTMLLVGLIMLFMTMSNVDMSGIMKDAMARKQFVEHPTMGILAAVLVTIGNVKSKKGIGNGKRFKSTMIFFGLALVLILSRLPFDKMF